MSSGLVLALLLPESPQSLFLFIIHDKKQTPHPDQPLFPEVFYLKLPSCMVQTLLPFRQNADMYEVMVPPPENPVTPILSGINIIPGQEIINSPDPIPYKILSTGKTGQETLISKINMLNY